MKTLGRLEWSKLCRCRDCGNTPKDPEIYRLRKRRIKQREKRQWRRERMMEA